jgi:pSer/pThr/pTyr-binding forkhead associated (FHA) protein
VLREREETRFLRLANDITHLGRGAGADVRFDEHRVSRDHAILVRHGRYWRLLDNRSANGTFVNDRRIVATTISSGDAISLGPVLIEYLEVD